MSENITLTVNGEPREVEQGTTGTDLFGGDKAVLVMRIDGELRDLFREIPDGASVEPVTAQDPEGLAVLRHSAAHVLAQAVQQINPSAKLGIGPPVTDGFYYDFDVAEAFTPDDLKKLEKAMQRIVNEGQTFNRRVITDAEGYLAGITDAIRRTGDPSAARRGRARGPRPGPRGAAPRRRARPRCTRQTRKRSGSVSWTRWRRSRSSAWRA